MSLEFCGKPDAFLRLLYIYNLIEFHHFAFFISDGFSL